MGIGVQGEACGEVAQHAGYRLDVHAVLQGDGGEGVAEIVEPDLWDPGSGQHSFEHIIEAVGGDGTAVKRIENGTTFFGGSAIEFIAASISIPV